MNNLNNNTTTYAQLLQLAEAATSRKEARHLINEATRLFEGQATRVGRIEKITPLGDALPVPLGNTEPMEVTL